MLPRWHIILGAAFVYIFYLAFPNTSLINLSLIFFASFLIDFDHYVNAVIRTKSFSLRKALRYYDEVCARIEREHKKGIYNKEKEFQFFHTIESHLVVFLLGFAWQGFWYILIGMVFHCLLDILYLSYAGYIYIREFSFFNYIINRR